MTVGTVVLLPPAELPDHPDDTWPRRLELAAQLMAYGVPVLVLPMTDSEPGLDLRTATAHWIAHNAIAMTDAQPEKPLLLVASGSAGTLLPALGFSQKASRRPVAGYVVVDGVLPKAGAADWPDAPVTYIATTGIADDSDAASIVRQAQLRGWSVATDADPAQVIRGIASE